MIVLTNKEHKMTVLTKKPSQCQDSIPTKRFDPNKEKAIIFPFYIANDQLFFFSPISILSTGLSSS